MSDELEIERRLRRCEQALEVIPPDAASVEQRLELVEQAVKRALLERSTRSSSSVKER